MKQFRVQVTNGRYDAPEIYIEAATSVDAEKEAKKQSGLGQYKNWRFIGRELKTRN